MLRLIRTAVAPPATAAARPRSSAALPLLLAAFALACGGLKDPASVADKFVDRYYVESDQHAALALSTGVATLRLNDELKLTRGTAPSADQRQSRVYYKRLRLDDHGPTRTADYQLDIRPQGGGELQRTAHLELQQQQDGTWRIARFSETQPR